jgi:hypothetical protein
MAPGRRRSRGAGEIARPRPCRGWPGGCASLLTAAERRFAEVVLANVPGYRLRLERQERLRRILIMAIISAVFGVAIALSG